MLQTITTSDYSNLSIAGIENRCHCLIIKSHHENVSSKTHQYKGLDNMSIAGTKIDAMVL